MKKRDIILIHGSLLLLNEIITKWNNVQFQTSFNYELFI